MHDFDFDYFQIKASAVDYSDMSTEQVKLMHDTKVYPPRVKMIVVMKSSNAFILPIRVEGSNVDEQLGVDLCFPFRGVIIVLGLMQNTRTLCV